MPHDFTAIYDLHRGPIFRYCFGKCRDREVGHDLTQETFLRFWTCLQRNDQILHVRGFLYHVANNLFVDHVRKKKEVSLDQMLETGFQPMNDPWHQTYSRLDAQRWMKKLQDMPPSYRKVLQYRFLKGLTPAEISTLTGETPNVVSVRIYRGLKHLRKGVVL